MISKPLHGNALPYLAIPYHAMCCACHVLKGEHAAWITSAKRKRKGIPRRSIFVSAHSQLNFACVFSIEIKRTLSVSSTLNYFFVKQSSNYSLLTKQSIKRYRFVSFCFIFFSQSFPFFHFFVLLLFSTVPSSTGLPELNGNQTTIVQNEICKNIFMLWLYDNLETICLSRFHIYMEIVSAKGISLKYNTMIGLKSSWYVWLVGW